MGAQIQKIYQEEKFTNIDMIYEKEKIKYAEIDKLFYKFDEDGDNYISESELINAINLFVKQHPEKREILEELINGLDSEANSKISLQTFRVLLTIYISNDISNMSILVDIFKTIDCNFSGKIESEEILHIFNKMGLNITKKESQELVDEANLDGDSGIDLDEFVRLMILK
jgi:calcium-binding protein CML